MNWTFHLSFFACINSMPPVTASTAIYPSGCTTFEAHRLAAARLYSTVHAAICFGLCFQSKNLSQCVSRYTHDSGIH
ncbi:hypothetical protein BDZ89DRAFT_539279 [Hymenopellis radicata]|nr:hypothetical protein BDZ89DRAFT_539279 [Hymenopellis radicata]